jgi:hypothetical protein
MLIVKEITEAVKRAGKPRMLVGMPRPYAGFAPKVHYASP